MEANSKFIALEKPDAVTTRETVMLKSPSRHIDILALFSHTILVKLKLSLCNIGLSQLSYSTSNDRASNRKLLIRIRTQSVKQINIQGNMHKIGSLRLKMAGKS